MMKITPYAFAAILLAVSLSACQDEVAPPSQPSASVVVGAVPADAEIPDFAAMTDDERAAYAEAGAAAHRAIQEAVVQATSWREADVAIRRELQAHPLVPDYELEQMAATYMMRQHIGPALATPTEALLEATGFYADLLIANESPDAPALADALTALDGHWPEARLQQAAATAAAAGERWLAKRAECRGCSLAESMARAEEEPAVALPEQTVSAVRTLERLAD